ncbi:MAG: hypothetical protein JSW38_00245 [Dehalococcoidia bacterium]|nr:MAG: hypothetical protein JSW38_00245 [Dehalococcoidia bacterium]
MWQISAVIKDWKDKCDKTGDERIYYLALGRCGQYMPALIALAILTPLKY